MVSARVRLDVGRSGRLYREKSTAKEMENDNQSLTSMSRINESMDITSPLLCSFFCRQVNSLINRWFRGRPVEGVRVGETKRYRSFR